MPSLIPQPEDICTAGQFAIRSTLDHIKWWLENKPERALETVVAPGRKNKEALRVDISAEDQFVRSLNEEYEHGLFKAIQVYGEESIDAETDFTNDSQVIALVDMVDGTDLVERNLSNWCSAAVFFCPAIKEEGRRILAACVGFPSGRIYYSHADTDRVMYKPKGGLPVPVGGPSGIMDLSEASICFYGQKASSLQKTVNTELLAHLLRPSGAINNTSNQTKKKNRIYTLAGIPMVVKLIDHKVKCAANIDVVFDCNGQRPHDFIAGAYLAKKVKAAVRNIDSGKEITYGDLEEALLRPDNPESDFRYVIASTDELCNEILPLVKRKGASGNARS
jgi:fructose-1,6-bisphosphatase/inositol monophosphatase family enzyme